MVYNDDPLASCQAGKQANHSDKKCATYNIAHICPMEYTTWSAEAF